MSVPTDSAYEGLHPSLRAAFIPESALTPDVLRTAITSGGRETEVTRALRDLVNACLKATDTPRLEGAA